MAADSCGNVGSPLSEVICADSDARAAYAQFMQSYKSALKRLSGEGQAILKASQVQWDERVTATCIAFPETLHKTLPGWQSNPITCIRDEIDQRESFLDAQGRRIGGYLWQIVDLDLDLYCLNSDDDTAPNKFQLSWAWPRIDAPSSALTSQWNLVHALDRKKIEADVRSADPCDGGGYSRHEIVPVYGQGDFVNLLDSETWSGVAHGMENATFSLELISTNRHLRAEDFFRPGSGWQKFIADRLFREAGAKESENSHASFEKYAGETERWIVDRRTLTYRFGPYELGGYLSTMSTTFTWKELRPYLRSNLPFHPDFK